MKTFLLGVLLVSIVGTLFLGYLAWELWHSEQTLLARQTVLGRILSIEIKNQARATVSGKANSQTMNYWMVSVTYEYVVGEKTYIGDRLTNHPLLENVDQHAQPSADLMAYLQRYPVGSSVTVHYDQNNPENSILEIDTSGAKNFFVAAIGAFCFGMIAVLLRFWMK